MNLPDQAMQVGKIVGNLLSLEFALRIYLYDQQLVKPHEPLPEGDILTSARVGDVVPHNALTSYHSLLQLIRLYNHNVTRESQIDESIATLRDTLAHGRVSAPLEAEHLRIIKFSDPRRGPLAVTVTEE